MPFLYPTATQATSGLIATATIAKKPMGEKIVIRRITVVGIIGSLLFAKNYGWIYKTSKPTETIGLFNKIVVLTVGQGAPEVFRGAVEWPEGFSLRLSARVQTDNETIRWAVEYDIVEEPEKRRRWGE